MLLIIVKKYTSYISSRPKMQPLYLSYNHIIKKSKNSPDGIVVVTKPRPPRQGFIAKFKQLFSISLVDQPESQSSTLTK